MGYGFPAGGFTHQVQLRKVTSWARKEKKNNRVVVGSSVQTPGLEIMSLGWNSRSFPYLSIWILKEGCGSPQARLQKGRIMFFRPQEIAFDVDDMNFV